MSKGGLPQSVQPTISEVVEQLREIVPAGPDQPPGGSELPELRRLTAELIQSYLRDGRLLSDPLEDARNRTIHAYNDEIREALSGKVLLVTGGSGCVGSAMLSALEKYRPRRIICLDIAAAVPASAILHRADVRDSLALRKVFREEKPQVVFHLAAQRNPGLAERKIRETIGTNAFGTFNIIEACEESGVEVCVFSSTGKASRYLTNEVYSASKKLAEWQFALANRSGRTRYVAARFTHIVNNSLVHEQLAKWISSGDPVGVHAPGRMVVAQNVSEAAHLLLNALLYAQSGPLRLLVVRNLGWPIETLELALYLIRQSGRDLPIYFLGVPPGYSEDFFRGQVDWRLQTDLHTLLNVLESAGRRIDPMGHLICTELEAFDEVTLGHHLAELRGLVGDERVPETEIRAALCAASDELCAGVFRAASPVDLLNILHWGVEPGSGGSSMMSGTLFRNVELVVQALGDRLSEEVIQESALKPNEYEALAGKLADSGRLPPAWRRQRAAVAGSHGPSAARISGAPG